MPKIKKKAYSIIKPKIKKGDTVKIIAGKNKGQTGEVIKVLKATSKILIKGINLVTDFNNRQNDGSTSPAKVERPIHISNVMYFIKEDNITTKLGYTTLDNGTKLRQARKNNKVIEDN